MPKANPSQVLLLHKSPILVQSFSRPTELGSAHVDVWRRTVLLLLAASLSHRCNFMSTITRERMGHSASNRLNDLSPTLNLLLPGAFPF